MESFQQSLKTTEESITDNQGFVKYVFSLNDKEKNELMNIFQYMILAIIPLVLVLKFMKHFIPHEDQSKGSAELLLEVLFQLSVIFVSFYFIHRIICYIPTYSQMNYPDFSFIYIILPTLFILFTMQTKLGSKINTLNNRLFKTLGIDKDEELVNKEYMTNNTNKPNPQQINSQGGHQQQQQMNNNNSGGMSHPYGGGNSPNFDQMYLDTSNPLVGANNPQNATNPPAIQNYNQPSEPMAANDFGGGFGSTFY